MAALMEKRTKLCSLIDCTTPERTQRGLVNIIASRIFLVNIGWHIAFSLQIVFGYSHG